MFVRTAMWPFVALFAVEVFQLLRITARFYDLGYLAVDVLAVASPLDLFFLKIEQDDLGLVVVAVCERVVARIVALLYECELVFAQLLCDDWPSLGLGLLHLWPLGSPRSRFLIWLVVEYCAMWR